MGLLFILTSNFFQYSEALTAKSSLNIAILLIQHVLIILSITREEKGMGSVLILKLNRPLHSPASPAAANPQLYNCYSDSTE